VVRGGRVLEGVMQRAARADEAVRALVRRPQVLPQTKAPGDSAGGADRHRVADAHDPHRDIMAENPGRDPTRGYVTLATPARRRCGGAPGWHAVPMRSLLCAAGAAGILWAAAAVPAAADEPDGFTIGDSRIAESSGLAASRTHPGIYWTHNDSSDGPYVYAVDGRTGRTVARITL